MQDFWETKFCPKMKFRENVAQSQSHFHSLLREREISHFASHLLIHFPHGLLSFHSYVRLLCNGTRSGVELRDPLGGSFNRQRGDEIMLQYQKHQTQNENQGDLNPRQQNTKREGKFHMKIRSQPQVLNRSSACNAIKEKCISRARDSFSPSTVFPEAKHYSIQRSKQYSFVSF